MYVPENWKEKFEEEYSKLRKDSQLRSWVLALIQQNWPFSWIKNPKVLKEIISREFSTELAEELTSDNLNDSKCPMIKITLDEKKAHFKGITNKLTKKAFSYQAKFGDKTVDFKNRY